MKVKAYYSRLLPFFLMTAEEMTDDQSFDAYPVMVDEVTLANCRSIRRLMIMMEAVHLAGSAPEDCAVSESAIFEDEVRRIFKTKAQDNRKEASDGEDNSTRTTKTDSSVKAPNPKVRKTLFRKDV